VRDDQALASTLESGAATLGLRITAAQREQLLALLDELLEWNTRFNLTAIRDPRDMVVKHLLDSLSVRPWLHGRRIADVGTGAGFPGLPLAIVDPERHFTLIESTGKKARFVAHAAAVLELSNVEVANLRSEAYRPRRPFDTVICRAVGKVSEFLRIAGQVCAPRRATSGDEGPASGLRARADGGRLDAGRGAPGDGARTRRRAPRGGTGTGSGVICASP